MNGKLYNWSYKVDILGKEIYAHLMAYTNSKQFEIRFHLEPIPIRTWGILGQDRRVM